MDQLPAMISEFFTQLEPEDVPLEYISAASYKLDGKEVILRGAELQRLIEHHPDYAMIKDAQIYINLHKVMKVVNLEIDYIHSKVNQIFRQGH